MATAWIAADLILNRQIEAGLRNLGYLRPALTQGDEGANPTTKETT